MKYLIFAYGEYKNNEKFVKEIALQIAPLSTSDQNIKYSYGEQNIIMYFNTELEQDQVKKYVSFIMTKYASMFFLMPCTDNMSYGLPKELKNVFFPKGEEFSKNMVKNVTEDDISDIIEGVIEENELTEEIELVMKDIVSTETNEDDMYEYEETEEESDLEQILKESQKQKKVTQGPSLDEILDKISTKGMNSLTKKEKELLDNYSKQ
jgi:hypothetical protein